jgi:hypothetical protein
MALLSAGQSSGTANEVAVQQTAAKDDAGASPEPKHDHARGTGHGPLAGDDEEQKRAAQQQGEEQQRATQQQDEAKQRAAKQQEEKQKREAPLAAVSGAGCGARAAREHEPMAAATANEGAAGGCGGPVPKQAVAAADAGALAEASTRTTDDKWQPVRGENAALNTKTK